MTLTITRQFNYIDLFALIDDLYKYYTIKMYVYYFKFKTVNGITE